jgi:hypothetical protein
MTTIVQSHHIVTPYYDEIIQDTNVPFWYLNQKHHHIPYQFFVLKTRLKPFVPDHYYIGFDHHRYFGAMHYTVVFSNNGAMVPLTQLEADKYQNIVNTIIKEYPTYCTIIYYKQPLISTKYNTLIPPRWVTSVLPYVYKLIDNAILVNGQIMVELDANDAYNITYKNIQNKFIDTMFDMYFRGTVVASATRDADVIEQWRLKPLYNTDNDVQLYTASWVDDRVSNASDFLMEQLHGNNIIAVDNITNIPNIKPILGKHYIAVDSYDNLTEILN